MTKALKRCPAGHNLSGYILGTGNAGSSSFFVEGIATWHGGRTDVMVTRPGRTAVNDALVTAPAVTAPGRGASASPLASGRSHGPEPVPRRSTRSLSPTRTQKALALPASVMTRVRPAGSRVPADPGLWQPDNDPALAGPAVEAPGCVPWLAVFPGTTVRAPEAE